MATTATKRKPAPQKAAQPKPPVGDATTNPAPYPGDTVIYVDRNGDEYPATVQLLHGGMTADLTVMLPAGATSLAHVPNAHKLSVKNFSTGTAHWKSAAKE